MTAAWPGQGDEARPDLAKWGTTVLATRALVSAAMLMLAFPAFVQAGPSPIEQAKLTAADPAALANFGFSVAVSGDTAVVGAYGTAYVFVRSGTRWTQQAELIASDATADDGFGDAVSVSGDTAIVGAPGADPAGTANAGAAYVFVRSGSSWTQQAKLTAADATTLALFGFAVALSDETAIVGAVRSESGNVQEAGAAYVFVRSGSSWSQQARLAAPSPAPYEQFGISVAVSGDTAVVGVDGADNAGGGNAGAACVFVRSGSTWNLQATLTATDAAPEDSLGWSVAIFEDTAVVGAPGDDLASGVDAGSAYVFVRSGTAWTQQAKLTAPDAAPFDQFGLSVAVSGKAIVVGAQSADEASLPDAGAAYFFFHEGSSWTEEDKLTASDSAASDYFGSHVAIDGVTVLAGAPGHDSGPFTDAGSAYAFTLPLLSNWIALEGALSGTAGTPALVGTGTLLPNDPVLLGLSHAKPFSQSWLVVGVSAINAPFKGGVMVPDVDRMFALTTDFFGASSFGGLWPTGVPSGFTTYFQWWIQDPASPKGFAASNAVSGTAP